MRWLVILTLAALSPACATIERWERPGATEAEQRRDEAECWARADNERAMPTRRLVTRPGSGVYETIELEPRREFDSALYEQCLQDRGYRRVPVKPAGG